MAIHLPQREKISFDESNQFRQPPAMLDSQIRRLLDAYPVIFLACHRWHLRTDEAGNAITEHQASILDHLDASQPVTLSKLAEHMGVSRSTMSLTVARLVRNGYIARRQNQSDARCIGLTLTPLGARVKEQNLILDPVLLREMFRRIPPAELEASLRGLECLAKYAGILLRRRKRERDA